MGGHFDDPIEAVVDYSFGNYKFLARQFPPLEQGRLTPESTGPPASTTCPWPRTTARTSTP
ncbi:MAG TPA: hypothetical protein VF056_09590 [Thermoleophilaceae bacterium]